MKYSEKQIDFLFVDNLRSAVSSLANLTVACGREPSFQGLNGWVFEQTIRYCLDEELALLGISLPITEQFKIKGRAKTDLRAGRAAIEIKAGGVFGDEDDKYRKYKAILAEKDLSYLYITRQETHQPYRIATASVFGSDKAFILTEEDSWKKFIAAVLTSNGLTSDSGG